MKNIHIGSIIRQKLKESPLSIREFAFRINRTRTTVYDIFECKSIDVDLLLRISEALEYNFLKKVYLADPPEMTSVVEDNICDCRYIVGVEVNKNELKNLSESEYSVVLKIMHPKEE